MSDNVIKSTDVNSGKTEKNPVKKAPAKKTATKKEVAKKESDEVTEVSNDGLKVIVFETGYSYISGDICFTKENNIQEVTEEQANFLLTLDNFRLPDQIELEDYINSKED